GWRVLQAAERAASVEPLNRSSSRRLVVAGSISPGICWPVVRNDTGFPLRTDSLTTAPKVATSSIWVKINRDGEKIPNRSTIRLKSAARIEAGATRWTSIED